MSKFFCPVASWFVDGEKCRAICDGMDGRAQGWNALPLGITMTHWTQKRCRACKRHFFGKEKEPV